MTFPEIDPQPRYNSIYDLLSHVADEAAICERDAQSELHEKQNTAEYLHNLRKRASLISKLPTMLEEYRQSGGIIPDEVEDFARYYADIANKALSSNRTFMLSTVLNVAPGGLATDPNDLERLTTRFDPSQER